MMKIDSKILLRTIFVIICIFLLIFPIFILINTSLKTYGELHQWPPTWFSTEAQWENYSEVLFGEKAILPFFTNSVKVSLATMLVCLVIGSLAAYGVTRYSFIGKKSFMVLVLITQMFSAVILVNPMYVIFRNFGLLNTHISLILANTATSLPMTIWLLYSYFSELPLFYEEASWMDGSTRLEGIINVVIPLAVPGIITAGLFAFITAWGDLIYARTFILDEAFQTLPHALTKFQDLYKTSWELQMSASVIMSIPPFIIFMLIQKHLTKGLGEGVKG